MQEAATASREACSGARTRSTSEATSVVTSRSSVGPAGPRSRIRRRPTGAVGHAQLDDVDVVGLAHQRALVGGRARGDGQHLPGAVEQDEARVERSRRRTHDLRQSRARLDGLGDGVERREIEPRLRPGSAGVDTPEE